MRRLIPVKIEKIFLRYRHLTQFEDYQKVEMTWNASERTYTAVIPGEFINAQWDVMYFVELIDSEGKGIRLPDMSKRLPYRIVSVKRD